MRESRAQRYLPDENRIDISFDVQKCITFTAIPKAAKTVMNDSKARAYVQTILTI